MLSLPRVDRRRLAAGLVAAITCLFVTTGVAGAEPRVRAVAETVPVPHKGRTGDAADDPAIWLHPTNRSQSTILGTDKFGGVAVYDLSGRQLHYYAGGRPNNIDVRYGFPLAGRRVALAVASDLASNSLRIWRVDPATRGLVDVRAGALRAGIRVNGLCLYHSRRTGQYFVYATSFDGMVQQWRLLGNAAGRVAALKVRQFDVGSSAEGCAADDELDRLYVGEENVALWRYGADPSARAARVRVDVVGAGGNIPGQLEGLALYRGPAGTGYLIASSQTTNEFVVYRRAGRNPYVTRFRIAAGTDDEATRVDEVNRTDGLDVTAAALGPAFLTGLLVAHDKADNSGRANYKLVRWRDVAAATNLAEAPSRNVSDTYLWETGRHRSAPAG